MILKCPSCSSLLSVGVEELRQAEQPLISCGSCQQKILLQPSKANCGSCSDIIVYHDYLLNPQNPLLPCENCSTINRMPIGENTFKKLKDI